VAGAQPSRSVALLAAFFSLSRERDEWTDRFAGIAESFVPLADFGERDAALRIASDDLDLLVDLSTHTKGARPGILALKPARVLITHIASAGTVGLSSIDFKLTDRYADVEENQAFQIETLLPMDQCVYPLRRVAPASGPSVPSRKSRNSCRRDPDRRIRHRAEALTTLLGLWREVLARIPRAQLAFSPTNPSLRDAYVRIAAAGGIARERLCFVPQGRDDSENQARYEIIDFVLDTMPFGGVNGTLEALDMGVPVVTLEGKRHGERSTYSILASLGVTDTVARTGEEYVEIACRLALDPAFMSGVRSAIRSRLVESPLADGKSYARSLGAGVCRSAWHEGARCSAAM
jgi:predicted O-linked N-acetylglucosamine transferase (SPINDLY family)